MEGRDLTVRLEIQDCRPLAIRHHESFALGVRRSIHLTRRQAPSRRRDRRVCLVPRLSQKKKSSNATAQTAPKSAYESIAVLCSCFGATHPENRWVSGAPELARTLKPTFPEYVVIEAERAERHVQVKLTLLRLAPPR